MANRYSSVVHFGTTFVPLGSGTRKAAKVFRDGRYQPIFVLMPNGKVATSYGIFDRVEQNARCRLLIARALNALGVMTRDDFRKASAALHAETSARERQGRAEHFADLAKEVGIKLTADQKRALRAA